MRTVSFLSLLLLLVAAAAAQDRLISPYQPQAQSGLRGLSENEIAELARRRTSSVVSGLAEPLGVGAARLTQHERMGPRRREAAC